MAKNNPYWGKQKGKLGETVLSVVKGQQVQRAYNGEPLNPRSSNQTGQRIIFANAVKFFKTAIAAQFKFAYEDKRQTESDYNAFMRHNISNGMMITRDMYVDNNYPSLGEFLLSVGSIPEIAPSTLQGTVSPKFMYGTTVATTPTTLQQLATALRDGRGLLDGDIITFVRIDSGAYDLTHHPSNPVKWNVVQVKIGDASDTRTIASVEPLVHIVAGTDNFMCPINTTDADGVTVIISRPTPGGLKVSTSRVWYNSIAKLMIEASQTSAYIKQAKNSWGMGTSAVLEGSLLPNQ